MCVLDRLIGGHVLDRLIGGHVLDRLIGGRVLDRLVGGRVLDRLVGGRVLDRLIGGREGGGPAIKPNLLSKSTEMKTKSVHYSKFSDFLETTTATIKMSHLPASTKQNTEYTHMTNRRSTMTEGGECFQLRAALATQVLAGHSSD